MRTTIWRRWVTALMFVGLVTAAAPAFAQGPGQGDEAACEHGGEYGKRGHRGKHKGMYKRLMKEVVPPGMLLKFADELELSDAQRAELEQLRDAVHQDKAEFHETMRQEVERLEVLLAAEPKVDVDAAMAQADRILALENDMKRARLEAMIQAKNLLTPEQLAKVKEKRKAFHKKMKGKKGKHHKHRAE